MKVVLGDNNVLECDVITHDMTRSSIPDMDWVYVDPAGHEHRWSGEPLGEQLITAGKVRTVFFQIVEAWCRDCGASFQPGYQANQYYERLIMGRQWYLNGEPIDEADAERLIAEFRASRRTALG